MIHRLSLLPAQDPYRARKEGEVLDKLYDMGILGEYRGELWPGEECYVIWTADVVILSVVFHYLVLYLLRSSPVISSNSVNTFVLLSPL